METKKWESNVWAPVKPWLLEHPHKECPLDEVTAGPVQGKDTETATSSGSEKTEGLVPDSAWENAVCSLSADLEDGIESVLIKFANASKLSLQVPRINKNINKWMSERRCRSIGRSAALAQTEIVHCKNKRWGINDEGTLMLNLGASVTSEAGRESGSQHCSGSHKNGMGQPGSFKGKWRNIFYSAMVPPLGPGFGAILQGSCCWVWENPEESYNEGPLKFCARMNKMGLSCLKHWKLGNK